MEDIESKYNVNSRGKRLFYCLHMILCSYMNIKLIIVKISEEEIHYASNPATLGLKASLHGLFYDFHCLINDEIIFLHLPKYIQDKKLELSEEEYSELDNLAELLLDPDKNFDKLLDIWNTETKFRIMTGALNG